MIRHPSRRWLAALVATCVLGSPVPLAAAPPQQQEPPPPPPPISLRSGPEMDRAIEQRITAIYAELPAMQGIEVEVESGVVHLRGQAQSLDARRQAQAMAERVEGVAAVDNQTQQQTKLRERLRPILEGSRQRTANWLTYLPLLLAAAGVIGLSWLLARFVGRRSRRHQESKTFARQFIDQIVRLVIMVIGIAIALELVGARGLLGGLIGTAGVIGIAIGVAFKSVGEAYVASVMLSLRRPFDPEDYVRIDENEGWVVRLTSRATVLMNLDGNHVLVPNSTVYDATIVNFTRNPQRRLWFRVSVPHEVDLCRVQTLAVATLATVPGVMPEPAPFCFIDEFTETAMIVSVTGWIDQRESDWFKVSSEARRSIKAAFEDAGIHAPEPSLRIRTTPSSTSESKPTTAPPRANPPFRDVSRDHHLERQVAQERAAKSEDDLLARRGGRTE